nr:helix-turn-helix transcriptional regulator [Thermobifida alba]
MGLPTSGTRRTPGLRREEVALLAGVGVSWYTWIEQGRAANVSGEVLDASPAPPTRPDAAALPPTPRRRRRRPRTGGVTPGPERRSNRSSTTGCRTRPTWPAATGTWSPSTRRPAT